MGGLLGGKSNNAQQTPAYTGLDVQTSAQGIVIPICYGTIRVAGNIIWYGAFVATANDQNVGGKGASPAMKNYTYTCGVAFGLGEGPFSTILTIYNGKNIIYPWDAAWPSMLGNFYPGSDSQNPDPWLTSYTSVNINVPSESATIAGVGSGAVLGTPVISGGQITSIPVTSGGSGYTVPPQIVTTGDGTGAYAVANVSGGILISVTMKSQGTDYTTASATVPAAGAVTVAHAAAFAQDNGVTGSSDNISYILSQPAPSIMSEPINLIQGFGYKDNGDGTYTAFYTVSNGQYIFPYQCVGKSINVNYNYYDPSSNGADNYRRTAYVITSDLPLDDSAGLPMLDYEVQALFSGDSGVGSGASLYGPVISNGAIQIWAVNNGGSGYSTPPQVEIAGDGNGAQAMANIDGSGHVVSITMISGGTNYTVATGVLTGGDANPRNVISDILTNTIYGSGYPSAYMTNLQTFYDYCQAMGFFVSYRIDSETAASDIIDQLTQACNSGCRTSQGVLDIIPYGDQDLSGNGATYTAPSAPLFDLTDDDFVPKKDKPPVELDRKDPLDVYNRIPFQCQDRTNSYNTYADYWDDLAGIQQNGLRKKGSISMDFFAIPAIAKQSASLLGQREAIKNTYKFTLRRKFIVLDRLDLVTITDSVLGLYRQWVRIRTIKENDNRELEITAEEYLNGTGSAPLYGSEASSGYIHNYNAIAPDANPPVFMEVPVFLAAVPDKPELWIAVSGPQGWGGCDAYISQDDLTYKKVGTVHGSARKGTLTAQLNAPGAVIDTTNVLSVVLDAPLQLLSGSHDDAENLNTLCWVGDSAAGELLAYADSKLTGAGAYDLSYLIREAYGIGGGIQASGTPFVRLDDSIFKSAYDPNLIGNPVYFKFVSFNTNSGGYQDISEVTTYQYTIAGLAYTEPQPPAPTSLSFLKVPPGNLQASWAFAWDVYPASLLDNIQYRIFAEAPQTRRAYNEVFQDLDAYTASDGINTAYINALYDMGVRGSVVTLGTKNNIGVMTLTLFSPFNSISREDAAKFLIGAWNGATTILPPNNTSPTAYFNDLTGNQTNYINSLYERGITTGEGSGIFAPTQLLTRGMAAAFIVRLRNAKLGNPVDSNLSIAGLTAYFNDLASDVYLPYINTLQELSVGWGIAVSTSAGAFSPNTLITRQTLALWTILALGQSGSSFAYNAYFTDIANDSFAPYVNKLEELGGTSGTFTGSYFYPNDNIIQNDFAYILALTLGISESSILPTPNAGTITRELAAQWIINAIGEVPSTVPYNQYFSAPGDMSNDSYAGYINRAFELGLTVGTSATTFSPSSNLTRAQAAIFCMRTINRSQLIHNVSGTTQYMMQIPDYAYFISLRVWAEISNTGILSLPAQATFNVPAPGAPSSVTASEITTLSGGSLLSVNVTNNDPLAVEHDIYIQNANGTQQYLGTTKNNQLTVGTP